MSNDRCAVCGWPLDNRPPKVDRLGTCLRGDCSMRPLPKTYYDPERAMREYDEAGYELPPSEEAEDARREALTLYLQRENASLRAANQKALAIIENAESFSRHPLTDREREIRDALMDDEVSR